MRTNKKEKIAVGLLLAASVLALLSACTKKQQMKNDVSPDAYLSKTDLTGCPSQMTTGCSGQKEYNMVDVVVESSGNIPYEAVPGMHNDLGQVHAIITEKTLRFESSFDVKAETRVIAAFPILSHFDISQATNDNGEKTNHIIEEQKRPWYQREYMRVDWANPVSKIYFKAFDFSTLSDAKPATTSLIEGVHREDSGVLSFKTENTFVSNSIGYDTEGVLQAGSYRSVAKTYLVPIKSAHSFVEKNYSQADFNKFGYFVSTDARNLIPEMDLAKDVKMKANLYDVCEASLNKPCSTKQIVFHLTSGMPEAFKEISKKVISEWNETFKKSLDRTDDVIILSSDEVEFGDITVNTIAYYPSPTTSGLLGVSQKMADRFTGETLTSRSTIYQDGINYVVKSVSDTLDLLRMDEFALEDFLRTGEVHESSSGQQPALNSDFKDLILGHKKASNTSNFLQLSPQSVAQVAIEKVKSSKEAAIARVAMTLRNAPEKFAISDISGIAGSEGKDVASELLLGNKLKDMQNLQGLNLSERMMSMTKYEREEMKRSMLGIHGTELVDDAAISYIRKVIQKELGKEVASGDLKTIQSALSSTSLRNKILDEVSNLTFYTTLLHEMGHSFGLRHNFHGSSDEKNFTPEYKEVKARLLSGDKSVTSADLGEFAYSSIMDYHNDFYAGTSGLGPYDHMAIRYGYRRNLDAADPSNLVKMKFCTDGDVGEDMLCRRFDSGVNISQITQNLINTYQRNYLMTRFSRGRLGFTETVPRVLKRVFLPVRQVMDELLYQIIIAKKVSANNKFGCDNELFLNSVQAGEIANICNNSEAEREGVDTTDISGWVGALFKNVQSKDANGQIVNQLVLRKPVDQYIPGGLADLLMANLIAQKFFTQVLGAPEPGTFLAEQVKGSSSLQLTKLDDVRAKNEYSQSSEYDLAVDHALTSLAQERGEDPLAFKLLNSQNVTSLNKGRFAKIYETKVDENTRNDRDNQTKYYNIGYKWDKMMALVALGSRDLGVNKYDRDSMHGNAYLWPQTKDWATDLVSKMITKSDKIATLPVKLASGASAVATVTPSHGRESQMYAMLVGTSMFSSEMDNSFLNQLRIFTENDTACRVAKSSDKVAVVKLENNRRFCAVQTRQETSASFAIAKKAEQLADKAAEARIDLQNRTQLIANAGQLLTASDDKKKAVFLAFADFETNGMNDLKPIAQTLVGDSDSIWFVSGEIVKHANEVGIFQFLDIRSQVVGKLQQVLGLIAGQIKQISQALQEGQSGESASVSSEQNIPEKIKVSFSSGIKTAGQHQNENDPRVMKTAQEDFQYLVLQQPAQDKPKTKEPLDDASKEILKKRLVLLQALFKALVGDNPSKEMGGYTKAILEVMQLETKAILAPIISKTSEDRLQSSLAQIYELRQLMRVSGQE